MPHSSLNRLIPQTLAAALVFLSGCGTQPPNYSFTTVRTIAEVGGKFGEPFGILVSDSDIFVADGQNGKVQRITVDGAVSDVATGLSTPSAIDREKDGGLIVADTGSNSIKKIDAAGNVTTLAGMVGPGGYADGSAASAQFRGPVGVAAGGDGKVYVSDTYNDRIRVIENGNVSTLAGGDRGYADGSGTAARFDTPLGIAVWDGRLLVADAGNRRIRVVEPDGRVWTLAGNGEGESVDGSLENSGFFRPTAITVSPEGVIYIADGDVIRAIGRRTQPFVETISDRWRGDRDGDPLISRFNRPSGLAIGENGALMVSDSDNHAVRVFDTRPAKSRSEPSVRERTSADEFKQLQAPRWPYDPPDAKRDIAGTLGEIRGELVDENSQVWFHNGLDIAGSYGETARFVRSEKVLDPIAAENFGTLRELIRLPTLGYIHIWLGRDQNNAPFGDPRFIFSIGSDGKPIGVRVQRGVSFNAGEPIGTLNPMNHVHLIAGSPGAEMNALAALILPNVSDAIAPKIENVSVWDENWHEIETQGRDPRITLSGKCRITVRAFDRMDGNPERRRLGVYRLGYQLFREDGTPAGDLKWSITFDKNPPSRAVKTVYAKGSRSGATGETVFNYIVTNTLDDSGYGEGYFDAGSLGEGEYIIRIFAADIFGNQTSKDIQIEVSKR